MERKNQTGICPRCKVGVRFEATKLIAPNGQAMPWDGFTVITPSNWRIVLFSAACPICGKILLVLGRESSPQGEAAVDPFNILLWPDGGERPVPVEVEAEAPQVAADFREASLVLPKSRKASAALSRRCLQSVLRDKGGANARDLADQIDEVLPKLPAELALNVDAIRHVGNYAAHPIKSKRSGEIVEVEDGEAEWLLDVLEELFEYYFVAPAAAKKRRDALNAKLAGLGKPPLKAP